MSLILLKKTWTAQSSDQTEPVNPVALLIRIPQVRMKPDF